MYSDSRFESGSKADASAPVDISISFPATGLIRFESHTLFAEPEVDVFLNVRLQPTH